MKITMIHGQNHKGTTYHTGRKLALKLTDEENIREFFLHKDLPHFCVGCAVCFTLDEKLCPHYEYVKPLADALDEADVIIFTTPVYAYHCTGAMKALLDHLAYRYMLHRPSPSMFSKIGVCIATAAGSGFKTACKDIADSMFYWGVPKIYQYGLAVYTHKYETLEDKYLIKIEKDTDALAAKIKKDCGRVSPGLKTKAFFALARMLNFREDWSKADVEYWEKMGWRTGKNPWN